MTVCRLFISSCGYYAFTDLINDDGTSVWNRDSVSYQFKGNAKQRRIERRAVIRMFQERCKVAGWVLYKDEV